MPDSIKTDSADSAGITIRREHFAAICAVALIASFFLPWLHVLFGLLSGFQFTQGGDKALLLWIMPVAAFIALVGVLSKHPASRVLAALAGLVPFAILSYGLYYQGPNLLKILGTGAWLGLGSGLALILVGAASPQIPGRCS